jgi:predicted patatin/cPLA2 family phospholipase
MPFCSRMVPIAGKKYLDGGIADSIPVRQMMKMGYDKVIVVLTQPADYRKGPMNPLMIKAFYRKYPNLMKTLLERPERYNAQVEDVLQLEKEEKIFVIRPEQALNIKRLEKEPAELARVHGIGLADGEKMMDALRAYLKR